MKPTVPDLVFRAAAAPTRNEPCSSAKVRSATLSALVEPSTIANLVFGQSLAARASGPVVASAPS